MNAAPIGPDELLDDPPDLEDVEREPEHAIDIGRADWHARRLRRLASERAEIDATVNTEIAKWQRWQAEQHERIERRSLWSRMTLQSFHATWYSKTRAATMDLPSGIRLRRRVQQPEYVRHEDSVKEWAEKHGYVRVTETRAVDWARIKREAVIDGNRLVLPDGSEVLGVVVVEREPAYNIDVPGDA